MKETTDTTYPAPGFSGYQIFVVAILAILQFSIVLDFSIISPLGDMLMKELQIDTSQFGLLVSCYAFGAGTSGILAATFADRFDRKRFLLFFFGGFIIGTFFCGLASGYRMLLIARSVTGLFGGVMSSISYAIVSDLFALNQRGRVMGYIHMAFTGSQILGLPAGILIANRWGWNTTFLSIVAVAAVIFVVVWWKMKPVRGHLALQRAGNPFRHLWTILSRRSYLTGFVLVMLVAMGGAMLMPFSSAFLINNVGVTQEQLPLVFLCTGISSLVVMPLVGRISDRVDKARVFLVGSIIAIVMTIVYTHMPVLPLWAVIGINILMFTGISSRTIPGMALNTAVPEKQDRGGYMSLCSSLQQMSNGLASLVAGFIVYQAAKESPIEHYDTLGYVVAVSSIVCIFLIYRISRFVRTRQEREAAASESAGNGGWRMHHR